MRQPLTRAATPTPGRRFLATPASGSTFTGWSGGGCSGTGNCVVVLNADTTVTAIFRRSVQRRRFNAPALKKTKSLVIGKASFSLASGASSTLSVKLSGPAKQELGKGKTLKAKVGGSGVSASTVKLKAAKKKG